MSKKQTPVSSGELNCYDLRIGNYVYSDCHPGIITTIHTIAKGAVRFDINPLAVYLYRDVIPVPLTPEILEKCGFVKDLNGDYWKDLQTHYLLFIESNDGFYPQYAGLPEMSSESEQIVSLHRINYVHELQNLYKILTGSHLTINL